jgi:hypothetical protein
MLKGWLLPCWRLPAAVIGKEKIFSKPYLNSWSVFPIIGERALLPDNPTSKESVRFAFVGTLL